MSAISIDVGAHLRAVRTMYGLSQRELAKRAGVTNGLISLIEQNRVSPSVSSLKKVLDGADAVLDVVPLVGSVYGTTKKVLSGFGGPQSKDAFQRFVFARLPGRTTPGFVTGSFKLTLRDGVTHDVLTVYVPTNHLYVGDVVILPVEDVVETDLSVEDGVSLLLSAGASVPLTIKER